jgi:hypothetical protein
MEKIPLDPFEINDIPYFYKAAGNTWILYSIGPDMEDNAGSIEYDGNVGIFGAGDIISREVVSSS